LKINEKINQEKVHNQQVMLKIIKITLHLEHKATQNCHKTKAKPNATKQTTF
jgi:hypothetical protein